MQQLLMNVHYLLFVWEALAAKAVRKLPQALFELMQHPVFSLISLKKVC